MSFWTYCQLLWKIMWIHTKWIQVFKVCMPAFDTLQEWSDVKKYESTANISSSGNFSSEANPNLCSHKNNTDNESETRIAIREGFDEQIRNYIPLDYSAGRIYSANSRNIACSSTKLFPKGGTSASSSVAGPSPDSISEFFVCKHSAF